MQNVLGQIGSGGTASVQELTRWPGSAEPQGFVALRCLSPRSFSVPLEGAGSPRVFFGGGVGGLLP